MNKVDCTPIDQKKMKLSQQVPHPDRLPSGQFKPGRSQEITINGFWFIYQGRDITVTRELLLEALIKPGVHSAEELAGYANLGDNPKHKARGLVASQISAVRKIVDFEIKSSIAGYWVPAIYTPEPWEFLPPLTRELYCLIADSPNPVSMQAIANELYRDQVGIKTDTSIKTATLKRVTQIRKAGYFVRTYRNPRRFKIVGYSQDNVVNRKVAS